MKTGSNGSASDPIVKTTIELHRSVRALMKTLCLYKHGETWGNFSQECESAIKKHALEGMERLKAPPPGKIQTSLEGLFVKHKEIIDEKWRVAQRYVLPVVIERFSADYYRTCEAEIRFEEDVFSLGEKNGLSFKQMLAIRTKLLRERYDAYLKRSLSTAGNLD